MGGDSPAAGAVFLSYASQDAEAARRISDALRAAGIEVWFDQRELRGGDAWDRKIRKQIHDCALFIPIISAHSQARVEAYFRLEWRLADQRTHLMGRSRAFLVPVCIDDTPDADADTPDSFQAVQWTRLPAGEAPPAFVTRISQLLSPSELQTPAPAHRAAGSAPSSRAPTPSAVASQRSKLAPLLVAAVVVIGAGYFAVDKFILSKRLTAGTPASTATSPVSGIPEKSIAVLPFADMSEKKDQEYFSDGLTEELLDLLSQVPDLRVPARTSSFFFKGKQTTIAEMAKALGVAHLLEGSVRKSGNTLRVTVQLIRADNGYHLWSKTYDREIKDIFKVQDEIAAAVVEALKVKLGPTQPVGVHRSSNPEAYNQYLIGRQFHQRENPDGWRRANEAFRKAIALDPDYAAAYAGLAVSEVRLADQTGDAGAFKQAEEDAQKAIALAPQEADGYRSRGYLRSLFGWDWAGAQTDFAKALLLDPASADVQNSYAHLLHSLGRLPEAIAAEKRAIELDPLSNTDWRSLGRYLAENRDYPAAREALRRALEIQPESVFALHNLARLQLLEGHAAEALATSRKITFEPFRLMGIAMAEHTLRNVKESQQALDELIAKHSREGAYQIAEVFGWRGEKDKAIEWLERAYQQRDSGLAGMKVDPLLESLHRDPRFKELLGKMKLPE